MNLLQMSFTGSIFIMLIFLLRLLAVNRLPKSTFLVLWGIAIIRLLIPFSIPSAFSVYSLFNRNAALQGALNDSPIARLLPLSNSTPSTVGSMATPQSMGAISFEHIIYFLGVALCLLIFATAYYCCMKKLRHSRPIRNSYISEWVKTHKIKRKIRFEQCDNISSPLTYGIFSPIILLPKNTDFDNCQELNYILLHEYLHIRRFDCLIKKVAVVTVCIHWFNPLVWVAFRLFCKDMEMSCDEAVIKKMGEKIKIDYCVSLMNLSTHHRNTYWLPVDFGENDIKGRIKNIASLRKMKKGVLAIVVLTVGVFIVCLVYLAFIRKAVAPEEHLDEETRVAENAQILDQQEKLPRTEVWLDITEHYRTHVGDPSNFYYIDENNVLWGSGRNEHGQLGQGTQDYDYHREAVRIAENVIHVDYSQKGFVIFLTEDHKLYGLGNAGCGALQQYDTFDGNRYLNDEQYFVSEPYLLMEQVKYACCGRDDIVCLAEDNTVWTWGTVWCNSGAATLQTNMVSDGLYFIPKPQKVLDNAVLVTGGWNNHAALLRDGTVWTWGYNSAGNCGVADIAVVSKPTMVAEDVAMVWTNLALENYPQPSAEDIALAWTGKRQYNMEYDNISEFNEIYPKLLNNTVIQKTDGSYWVCGENVGEEEERVHGAEADYFVICTYQFLPCK